MDDKINYYLSMTNKNRLYAIRKNGKLIGWITYYLCNGDINKYINKEPYEVLEDNKNGDTCYIDHLIGTYGRTYAKESLQIWFGFKDYIKRQFPQVDKIRWIDGRKNKDINKYKEEL